MLNPLRNVETTQYGWCLLKKIQLQFFNPLLHPGPPKQTNLAFTKPHDDWNNLLLQIEKPTTKRKGEWRQTSTGGLISNSMKHMQLPLFSKGIQHLKKRRGHFCATESWLVSAVVWRRRKLYAQKLAQDATLLKEVALSFPSTGWCTLALDLVFILFSTAPRNSLTELISFARQGQRCRATTPGQQVLQSFPQTVHVPKFPPSGGYALIHGCLLLLQDNILWK